MFRQIMIPLDGSEVAERALPYVAQLAPLTGATIHLVRVVQPPPPATSTLWGAGWEAGMYVPASTYDELFGAATKQATEYLDTVRERLTASDVPVQVTQLAGDAAVALLDYERDTGIDLVVMCSHGRSALARFAFGSVADRLLRHGTAPMLLVRAFGAPVTLAQAVVPLDGSARAEEALHLVEQLAPDVMHAVTLLRVIDAPEQRPEAERYLAQIAPQLPQEHVLWHSRVEQGDPAETIIAVADPTTLVAMATHGRSGLTRWALGSVADRVVRGGVAGVLLVRGGLVVPPSATHTEDQHDVR